MSTDGYAGAIDLVRLQWRLERCSGTDAEPASGECAMAIARDCVCPCIACEETVCNALSGTVTEALRGCGLLP